MRSGFILNLNSTGAQSSWRVRRVVESAKKMGAIVKKTKSMEEMRDALREFVDKNIELLLIGGGDGTIQKIITFLFNEFSPYFDPLIFHVPLGASNVFCKNLQVDVTPLRLLWSLRRRINKGNFIIKKVPTIRVFDENFDEDQYGFIFVAGVGYYLTKMYKELPPGMTSVFKVISSAIMEFISYTLSGMGEEPPYIRRIKISLTADNYQYSYNEAIIVLASVFPNPILWFTPFYKKSSISPEGRYYLFVNSMSNKEIAYNMLSLFSGRKKYEKSFNEEVSHSELLMKDGYALDGEIVEKARSPRKIIISPGPSLRVLYLKPFYSMKER